MIDDNREVLAAIGGLKDLVEAKHEHLLDKVEGIEKTADRLTERVVNLYELDRERSKEIGDLEKNTKPAVDHAKNSSKVTIAVIVSGVGAFTAAVATGIIALFKSNGG